MRWNLKNLVLATIIGFMIGVVSYYYLGMPRIITQVVEVEKMIPVEIIKVERVEIPKIVTKEVIKIKEVPTIKKVTQTRVIYLPAKSEEEVNKEQQYCMALNIYREANNQSYNGMIAVGRVVMNRVQDNRWPGDPCSVIYEGPVRESWKTKKYPDLSDEERVYNPVRNRCQFSWYCDGKKDELINTENNIKWKVASAIAYEILAYDKWNGIVEGANHYHADYVKPSWRKQMQLISRIDDHIFYRQE